MADLRARYAELMRDTLADEAHFGTWTYHAVRPMPVPPSWQPRQKVVGDCSKGVQYICRWGGGPDPMKEQYDVYGNSSTLWLKNQHLDHASDLLVGDFVTFGNNGDEHATMVLETGSDPLLWSFGHQGAPNTYRLSQDGRARQFLRNPVGTYVPTPADKLRAKTGWFAWMAWYQGEGDWAKYAPRTQAVRPHVPKLIPPTWWARRIKFLARRKSGS